MRRVRVSIAGLMGVVVLVAVGTAALREASEVWSGILFALTAATLGFAALRAAYREGAKRAFWAGFALFGMGYLVLAFGPGSEARPSMPTAELLTWLHPKVVRQQLASLPIVNASGTIVTTTTGAPMSIITEQVVGLDGGSALVTRAAQPQPSGTVFVTITRANPTTFVRVGHCLSALLVGMLGGGIARWQWAGGTRPVVPLAVPATTDEEPPCPDAAS